MATRQSRIRDTPSGRREVGAGAVRRAAIQKIALGVGLVFLAVGILGFIPRITTNDRANFVPVDDEDNWLHLGVGMVALGLIPTRRRETLGMPAEHR